MSIDVVLVRPWARSAVPEGSLVEDALAVGYLASSLRAAGISVAVVDAFTLGLDDVALARCAAALEPALVGVSLHSFADYKHTVAVAEELARSCPGAYRLIGGEHATFLAREILTEHPVIDAVVMGEGERTVVELARNVLAGERHGRVSGAVTRDAGGGLADGGMRSPVGDLDELPRPSKDLVELAIAAGRPVAVSLLTGRGCTHKCTFCTANTYLRMGTGVVWRRRRPAAVAEEFAELVEAYAGRPGVHPMIQFQDVIFLGASKRARAWVEAFVSELERRSLRVPYYVMARAEAIIANAPLLPRLAASGLASVEVGIESGVDRILQLYNKRNSADRNHAAIRLLQEHGICYDASGFIMFDPRIRLAELRVNAAYLHDLGHATWDRYVTKLQVFPGTAIRPQLVDEGLFEDDAALDDVYAYRYLDERMAALAAHVWMYDEGVRAFDNTIHHARSIATAPALEAGSRAHLRGLITAAQEIYRDHFLALVDLAEAGELHRRFEWCTALFIARVEVARAALAAACEEAADFGGATFLPLPAPAPESELVGG